MAIAIAPFPEFRPVNLVDVLQAADRQALAQNEFNQRAAMARREMYLAEMRMAADQRREVTQNIIQAAEAKRQQERDAHSDMMEERRMNLAERGDLRADRSLEHSMSDSDRRFGLSQDSFSFEVDRYNDQQERQAVQDKLEVDRYNDQQDRLGQLDQLDRARTSLDAGLKLAEEKRRQAEHEARMDAIEAQTGEGSVGRSIADFGVADMVPDEQRQELFSAATHLNTDLSNFNQLTKGNQTIYANRSEGGNWTFTTQEPTKTKDGSTQPGVIVVDPKNEAQTRQIRQEIANTSLGKITGNMLPQYANEQGKAALVSGLLQPDALDTVYSAYRDGSGSWLPNTPAYIIQSEDQVLRGRLFSASAQLLGAVSPATAPAGAGIEGAGLDTVGAAGLGVGVGYGITPATASPQIKPLGIDFTPSVVGDEDDDAPAPAAGGAAPQVIMAPSPISDLPDLGPIDASTARELIGVWNEMKLSPNGT